MSEVNEKYDRQLAAWAVDRALEFLKGKPSNSEPKEVTDVAEHLVNWICQLKDAAPVDDRSPEEKAYDEQMQAAVAMKPASNALDVEQDAPAPALHVVN